MIILGSTLDDTPVMSLQTGGEIARTSETIIDPKNLAVLGYVVTGDLIATYKGDSALRIADVRELSDIGMIVDSIDEIVQIPEVVSLHNVFQLHFTLLHKRVLDESRSSLGKVIDYTLETGGFYIQQLIVKRPFFKRFSDTELIIHRTQIIEITHEAIVVRSAAKIPEPSLDEVTGSYINPFRKARSVSDASTDSKDS